MSYEKAKEEAIQTVLNTSLSVQEAVGRAGYRHGVNTKRLGELENEVRAATSFAPSAEVLALDEEISR